MTHTSLDIRSISKSMRIPYGGAGWGACVWRS